MKAYVSGRIKNYPDYLDHFDRGCVAVSAAGYEAVNPCELGEPHFTVEEFMRDDLKALLDCDAIYMLSGWERSVGARAEHMVAAVCGLRIYYEEAQAL